MLILKSKNGIELWIVLSKSDQSRTLRSTFRRFKRPRNSLTLPATRSPRSLKVVICQVSNFLLKKADGKSAFRLLRNRISKFSTSSWLNLLVSISAKDSSKRLLESFLATILQLSKVCCQLTRPLLRICFHLTAILSSKSCVRCFRNSSRISKVQSVTETLQSTRSSSDTR